jgi:hypothetical protein
MAASKDPSVGQSQWGARKALREKFADEARDVERILATRSVAVVEALYTACVKDRNPYAMRIWLDRFLGPVPKQVEVDKREQRQVEVLIRTRQESVPALVAGSGYNVIEAEVREITSIGSSSGSRDNSTSGSESTSGTSAAPAETPAPEQQE